MPKYRKWELGLSFLYIVLWAPVSLAVYIPLHLIAIWRAEALQTGQDSFVFFMDGTALWIPAFFMALLLSGYLLVPIIKYLLKDRYTEYDRYIALKFGFDQDRVARGLGGAISIAFLFFVMALFDTYLVASADVIKINPFTGLERRYAYSDITQIITAPALVAPNGNTVSRRVYLLRFADNWNFSTDSIPNDELNNRSYHQLIDNISKRSGIQPIEKPVFEKGEL